MNRQGLVTTVKSRPNTISLAQFVFGGISPSPFTGERFSFADFVDLDPFRIPNTLSLAYAPLKAVDVPEVVKTMQKVGDYIVMFGYESGNVYLYDIANKTLTNVYQLNDAGCNAGKGILGSAVYDGYLYFATQNHMHRIPVDKVSQADFATWVEPYWQITNRLVEFGGDEYSTGLKDMRLEDEKDYIKFKATFGNTDGIYINLSEVPSSALCVYIHEVDPEVTTQTIGTSCYGDICDSTISCGGVCLEASDLKQGWNCLPYKMQLNVGKEYHIHIWSQDGTGAVASTLPEDMQGADVYLYYEGDAEYKPMVVQNNILYVGDQQYVHQVRQGRFTARALDIPKDYRITALGKYLTNLVIGTRRKDNQWGVEVFRWNTWSDSFDFSDVVPELEIASFAYIDNALLFVTHPHGNVYQYMGHVSKRIKAFGAQDLSTAWTYATGIWKDRAVSTIKGQGAHWFGQLQDGYPLTVTRLFDNVSGVITSFVPEGEHLWFTAVQGSDTTLYVAGDKFAEVGSIVTRVVSIDTGYNDVFTGIYIEYQQLPKGTDVRVYIRSTPFEEWEEIETRVIENKRLIQARMTKRMTTMQFKIELVSDDQQLTTPIVSAIGIMAQ